MSDIESTPEHENQGISRRDLLKRGAALGGAVVWATPVVQTLGMGRAFASTASPVGGRDVSYVAISVADCEEGPFIVKYNLEPEGWELGKTPYCPVGDADALGDVKQFPDPSINGGCATVTVPSIYKGCIVVVYVTGGRDCASMTVDTSGYGPFVKTVCTPTD